MKDANLFWFGSVYLRPDYRILWTRTDEGTLMHECKRQQSISILKEGAA
ncbi:hypothetical protein HG15A2_26410 [Adhaeretor mobilis]|uniref:Uncharacterized protein n=1 Tax=Adhaeretor mobilis TaxID=1930276 RepID=A0A517MWT2_9BACT|nr:hypothetical protein HG15A2_26410 [Adhaeretor mobilis]